MKLYRFRQEFTPFDIPSSVYNTFARNSRKWRSEWRSASRLTFRWRTPKIFSVVSYKTMVQHVTIDMSCLENMNIMPYTNRAKHPYQMTQKDVGRLASINVECLVSFNCTSWCDAEPKSNMSLWRFCPPDVSLMYDNASI